MKKMMKMKGIPAAVCPSTGFKVSRVSRFHRGCCDSDEMIFEE